MLLLMRFVHADSQYQDKEQDQHSKIHIPNRWGMILKEENILLC